MIKRARKGKVAKKTKPAKKTKAHKKTADKKTAKKKRSAPMSAVAKSNKLKNKRPAITKETVVTAIMAQGPALAPMVGNAVRIAVVNCVNRFMDTHRPGWNNDLRGDDRSMGADYHYPPQAIPAPVLSDIQTCLQSLTPQAYTFAITAALVASCAAGTLANLKFQVAQVTRVWP